MSATMNTILVVGGTSGIGESFAKRWISLGKKVITTGRRQNTIPGADSYVMDNTDLAILPGHVKTLFERYPDLDTVWINSGTGTSFSLKDLSSATDQSIINEITTNITGPVILARHFIPHLLAQNKPTKLMLTGSGLGFVPSQHFPTYCSTKAYTHSFAVAARQALQGTNVSVTEVVPPLVKTNMHMEYEEVVKGLPAMTLEQFTDDIFEQLDGSKAEELKEVVGGHARVSVNAWRGSIGAILENRQMGG